MSLKPIWLIVGLMHRTLMLIGAIALVVAAAAPADAQHHITIRHQDRGCHAWSADGGSFRTTLTISLRAGQAVEFVNDDVMAHRLVQLSGPRLSLPGPLVESTFKHPGGGAAYVRFLRAGTYRLRTVDGSDNDTVRTIGAENVLRLFVRVT